MLKPIALANTLALLDLIGHPLIHLWVSVYPQSYESLMQLFVAGLHLSVEPTFELLPTHLLLSTVVEASTLWLVGYIGGSVYNMLSDQPKGEASLHQMTLSFFFGEFHKGFINRLLHGIGFILFAVGIWQLRPLLIIFSLVIQESGHIIQQVIIEKRKIHLFISHIISWQIVVGTAVLILYALLILTLKQVLYGN